MSSGAGPSYPGSPTQAKRWIPFKNNSGETIPAFAVMKVTHGIQVNGVGVLMCTKPDGIGRLYAFNGPRDVSSSASSGVYGKCTFDFPATALYTSGSGACLGPKSGEWSLQPKFPGFVWLDSDGGTGSNARARVLERWWGFVNGTVAYGGAFDNVATLGSVGSLTTTSHDGCLLNSVTSSGANQYVTVPAAGHYLVTYKLNVEQGASGNTTDWELYVEADNGSLTWSGATIGDAYRYTVGINGVTRLHANYQFRTSLIQGQSIRFRARNSAAAGVGQAYSYATGDGTFSVEYIGPPYS